jgi:hypothetical protein
MTLPGHLPMTQRHLFRASRKRPGYREALSWIALNDDTQWLDDDEPIISVSTALVADLFGKDEATIIADLRRQVGRRS